MVQRHRPPLAPPVETGGEQAAAIAALGPLLSVRELQSERGLSQGQLASEMGVSRRAINSIEQERYTPSLPQALALALFLETTVEAMFDARD
jgi:putative transcriptional regulator